MKNSIQLLIWGMLIHPAIAWGKPAPLVEAINQLDKQWEKTQSLEVIPTGPVFFGLVMLEQLASRETAAEISPWTNASQWKENKPQAANKTGWLKLDSTWWLSSLEVPSQHGRNVTSHYRTALASVDFHSRQALESLPIGVHVASQPTFSFDSILHTQVAYAPQIPGGLLPASGLSEFTGLKGIPHPAEFLQTQIIPVQWHESGKDWLVRIPLSQQSGWLTAGNVSPNSTNSLEWKEIDAIIFLPQKSAESVFRPSQHGAKWNSIVGSGSNYGRTIEYGQLALNEWVIQTQINFLSHQNPSLPHPQGKKIHAPRVIRLDRPFYYRIEGPHGETIFRGQISSPNIK